MHYAFAPHRAAGSLTSNISCRSHQRCVLRYGHHHQHHRHANGQSVGDAAHFAAPALRPPARLRTCPCPQQTDADNCVITNRNSSNRQSLAAHGIDCCHTAQSDRLMIMMRLSGYALNVLITAHNTKWLCVLFDAPRKFGLTMSTQITRNSSKRALSNSLLAAL